MENREKFSSRIGFLLISAGCAIGLGNVWRFPFITGQYGGAAFVLIYLFFLIILGLPILVMEYAMALVQLCWYGWKLSIDDVLHDSSRMDDQLFL